MADRNFVFYNSAGELEEHAPSLDSAEFVSLKVTGTITDGNHVVNKTYVDQLIQGVEWQDSVLDKDTLDPTSLTPTTGDRYIIAGTGAGAWAGQDNNIAEWNGSSWDFTTATEGFAAWIDDEDVAYVFNGTSWAKMAGTFNHNDLSGLQGGTTGEYYHMTSAEDTWLATVVADIAAGNVADLSDNETITGAWGVTGSINFANGALRLPSSAPGTPVEGDIYWDGTGDDLLVYNGSSWQSVGPEVATKVGFTMTAGTGGITQYQPVYVSSANTVLPADASAIGTARVVGISNEAITAASQGTILREGVITGQLSGATPGAPVFLSETAGSFTLTPPNPAQSVIMRVGYAINATDFVIALGEPFTRRAA